MILSFLETMDYGFGIDCPSSWIPYTETNERILAVLDIPISRFGSKFSKSYSLFLVIIQFKEIPKIMIKIKIIPIKTLFLVENLYILFYYAFDFGFSGYIIILIILQ